SGGRLGGQLGGGVPYGLVLVGDKVQRLRARVAAHRFVRLVDEALDAVRQPVIPPRGTVRVAHPLLHDAPVARGSEEEDVVVELVTVLDGRAVHLRRRAARVDQGLCLASDPIAGVRNLLPRPAWGIALAAGGQKAYLAIDLL